jgi:carboxylesterase type B
MYFNVSLILGVAHGDELGYMFNTIISTPIEDDSDENRTLTRVVKMWTNFAKTG